MACSRSSGASQGPHSALALIGLVGIYAYLPQPSSTNTPTPSIIIQKARAQSLHQQRKVHLSQPSLRHRCFPPTTPHGSNPFPAGESSLLALFPHHPNHPAQVEQHSAISSAEGLNLVTRLRNNATKYDRQSGWNESRMEAHVFEEDAFRANKLLVWCEHARIQEIGQDYKTLQRTTNWWKYHAILGVLRL